MADVGDDDRVFCVKCGEDLTELHARPGPRVPCPVCSGMVRRIQGRAALSLTGAVTRGDDGSVTVLPPTAQAAAQGIVPTIGAERVRAHFEHMVLTCPPSEPGDVYTIEIINPDTGVVDIAMHADPEEAFRGLAKPFADDI
jgi:hypothetical protein